MNNLQPLKTIYLILFILLFLLLGLAGCALIQPIPAGGLPTEVSVDNVQDTPGEDSTGATNPGTEPAPTTLTYTNKLYGFQFEYPNTWALEEADHAIVLTKGTNRLGIKYGFLDEQSGDYFRRTGVGAGDFIYAEKINFMGQVIPAEALIFEGKTKGLFFGGTSLVETSNLVFMIVLEDLESDYLQVDLPKEIMNEAITILESFKPIVREGQDTSTAQTGLHAILEIPEHLPLGENINLKFTLKNETDSPLYVLNWYTPLEGIGGEIFRVTYDGEPIQYVGILASRATPTADAYVLLNPGESASAVVDLAPSYDFDRAGVYKIEFLSPRISHIAHSEDEMASTMEELGPVEIPSNTVNVELVDDLPGDRLPQLRTPEDAQELIESHLRNQGLELGIEPILPVEELHFEGLWSALRAQVFRVSGGKFLNDTFLLRGADVIQLGAGLRDQGNTSIDYYADEIVEFALTEPAFLEHLQASPIPVNCITPITPDPQTSDKREELLACEALHAFFHHLHAGEYERAVEYYGGSYEAMRDHNPGLDPDDYAVLFKNACTVNGAQCLEIQKATFIGQPSPAEYRFSVQFANEDGSTFGRGPCCGDDNPNQSVQYAFTYTLRLEPTEKYLVLDMPVYAP